MLSVMHVVAPVSVAAFAFVLLRVAFSWWVHCTKHRAERARLPPGPRAIPFLGNVHQLPMDYQEKTFAEWAKQYGVYDIFRLFAISHGRGRGSELGRVMVPPHCNCCARARVADLEGGVLNRLSV